MATKLKAKAAAYAPQTRADVQADIKKLGDLQREHERLAADMNDAIANITEAAAPGLAAITARIGVLQTGIQTWCEAYRDEITSGGKTKTANLVTGEVNWRQRPPSVTVRNAEGVIETFKSLGLSDFVRTKEEVNKEAILAAPEKARGIAGVSINSGVEDFVITPFEANTEVAA